MNRINIDFLNAGNEWQRNQIVIVTGNWCHCWWMNGCARVYSRGRVYVYNNVRDYQQIELPESENSVGELIVLCFIFIFLWSIFPRSRKKESWNKIHGNFRVSYKHYRMYETIFHNKCHCWRAPLTKKHQALLYITDDQHTKSMCVNTISMMRECFPRFLTPTWIDSSFAHLDE